MKKYISYITGGIAILALSALITFFAFSVFVGDKKGSAASEQTTTQTAEQANTYSTEADAALANNDYDRAVTLYKKAADTYAALGLEAEADTAKNNSDSAEALKQSAQSQAGAEKKQPAPIAQP